MGNTTQPGLQVQDGEVLKEITTGQLGFKTTNGEVKIRLIPTPWPSEDPPIPSAQLLSVASSQGVLAAAGPDELRLVSTDQVRETLSAKDGNNIRDVAPILTLPHQRISHVAFTSDESVLIAHGQNTGGLIAYEVNKLKAGQNEAALTIDTQTALRALCPNPNPQSAHLVALVGTNGNLMMADLRTGQLVEGSNGVVLSTDVVCVSWSNRGKQLVAGNASGTALQLKPDGTIVAQIPKSTSIPESTHMSVITWLEDDTFFVIYTPTSASPKNGIPPSVYYIIERSNKTNYTFYQLAEVVPPFGVERLPTHHFVTRLRKFDPHITDLLLLAATSATDIGIVSKSSQPLGVGDSDSDVTTNAFTLTMLEDDTKRAALPLSVAESLDTSPIGMAIDLSSKEPVINPLSSDPEIQESAGPVPSLLVLNNEGLLSSWWVIYADSIREKTTFSGFDALKTLAEIRSATLPPPTAQSSSTPSRSATSFSRADPSAASPFMPNTTTPNVETPLSTFRAASSQSAFGAPKLQPSGASFGTGSGFGTASKIGEGKPSWTNTGFSSTPNASSANSAFGQVAFGSPSFGKPPPSNNGSTPAFGSTTAFGNRASAFGQTASPAFGQSSFPAGSKASPSPGANIANTGPGFASFASSGGFGTGLEKKPDLQSGISQPPMSSGFASFAGLGGFGNKADTKDEKDGSPFGKPSATGGFASFAQTNASSSPFGKPPGTNAFGQGAAASTFGKSSSFGALADNNDNSQVSFGVGKPFQLGSTFKGDGSAKDDLPAPSESSSVFGLGSGLGNLLGEAKKNISPTRDTEAEMDDDDDQSDASESDQEDGPVDRLSRYQQIDKEVPKQFITPPSTIAHPKVAPAPPVSNLFGPPQQQQTTPQPMTTGFSFASTTPKDTPAASNSLFNTKPFITTTPATQQKKDLFSVSKTTTDTPEPETETETMTQNNEEAIPQIKAEPTSDEDIVDLKSIPEAPLPPDFISMQNGAKQDTVKAKTLQLKETDDAPLPPDFLPANKSAIKAAETSALPEDEGENEGDAEDDEFSSDFEDSGEDVTEDISPANEVEDDQDGDEATTEQIQTSPESSFKAGDTTSPTEGLFTKVSVADASKPTRTLFGEVTRTAPVFPPPKTQQSPRSPSPVRPSTIHDTLRSDSRSVSAPLHTRTAIDQRKAEYSQSAIAAKAARAREEEVARERTRLAAIKAASEKVQAEQLQALEDNEDERIQRELALPIEPSQSLDEFITHQAGVPAEGHKADIPAQIERLYQDINSMICTTGINARSLSAFMMYQKTQPQNEKWPGILGSDAPMDALDKPWSLNDIHRLREGSMVLAKNIDQVQVQAVPQKLEICQNLLSRDLFDLRTRIVAIRKSLYSRASASTATTPLSAEQASIQHDLRKVSAAVQMKLVQIEDALAVTRARLAEFGPSIETNKLSGTTGPHTSQKKPTVEAVLNTVTKMTSMAERKSADIDVLEAQLRKLDISFSESTSINGQLTEFATPRRFRVSNMAGTPGSNASSLFYTPDSRIGASAKSGRSMRSHGLSTMIVSTEDRDRWTAKAARKREIASMLRTVLKEKN